MAHAGAWEGLGHSLELGLGLAGHDVYQRWLCLLPREPLGQERQADPGVLERRAQVRVSALQVTPPRLCDLGHLQERLLTQDSLC